MKRSIRTRFTIIFLGLMTFILVAIWCINSWYLESFYLMDKLNVLENVYQRLDHAVVDLAIQGNTIIEDFENSGALVNDELGKTALLLKEVSETYNLSIVINDSLTGEALLPSQWDGAFLSDKMQRYIYGDMNLPEAEILRETDNYTIQKAIDPRLKTSYLESWGYFSDNRTVFIISLPLASVQDSVVISNRFLAYVGMIAIIISSLIVYLTSAKITLPIKQLASLSEKMSNLDFEAKYEGHASDEIGVLGHSMNKLSDKLKDTIGEIKSVNLKLQKDIEQKIQIDEMRKDFIANVSHELKTPIALIQGYSEGLMEGMAVDEENRNYYCQVIVDEASKMNKMVSQLLSLTALEFGRDQAMIERFDIVSLIHGVLLSMDIIIQQNKANVSFEYLEPIYVWADEFKTEQVVRNYLSNALNHLGGNKDISLSIEEGELVRVAVINSGEPIPEEALSQLWTKFYKVDKARTREYGGSGIGLSIVKAIMDAHHQTYGVINHETSVEFWFTLSGQEELMGGSR